MKKSLILFAVGAFSSSMATAKDFIEFEYGKGGKNPYCSVRLDFYNGKTNTGTCDVEDTEERRDGERVRLYCSNSESIRNVGHQHSAVYVGGTCSSDTWISRVRVWNDKENNGARAIKFLKSNKAEKFYTRHPMNNGKSCFRQIKASGDKRVVVRLHQTASKDKSCKHIDLH